MKFSFTIAGCMVTRFQIYTSIFQFIRSACSVRMILNNRIGIRDQEQVWNPTTPACAHDFYFSCPRYSGLLIEWSANHKKKKNSIAQRDETGSLQVPRILDDNDRCNLHRTVFYAERKRRVSRKFSEPKTVASYANNDKSFYESSCIALYSACKSWVHAAHWIRTIYCTWRTRKDFHDNYCIRVRTAYIIRCHLTLYTMEQNNFGCSTENRLSRWSHDFFSLAIQ
jgi:hypothetical protein